MLGCEQGWHGSSDIIIQGVPVTVFHDTAITDQLEDYSVDSDSQSVSSNEEKSAYTFTKKDLSHLVAKTIVNAFLQRKLNDGNLKNYLIPGIGISKKKMIVCFYDSVNDVLLQSLPINLFEENTMVRKAVLFLWLTLNYHIFCSGITEDMKEYKAGFIEKLGKNVNIYTDDVKMPIHVPSVNVVNDEDLFPWSNIPRPSEVRKNPDVEYEELSGDDF